MRINPRKIQKILGRFWKAPKRIFETFLHSISTKMHQHECKTHNFVLIQKIKQRIFPILYYL
jgi:metal-dependent HD superfamily phosphatase/phosphodiesterase